MFKAINQFFVMLFTFFSAGEKAARALDHVAEVAVITAEGYEREQKILVNAKLARLIEQERQGMLPELEGKEA